METGGQKKQENIW